MVINHNPYYKRFRTFYDLSEEINENLRIFIPADGQNPKPYQHKGQFNLPTGDNAALILTGNEYPDGERQYRSVELNTRERGL